MEEPLGAGSPAGGPDLPCSEAIRLGGGLPGGVVEVATIYGLELACFPKVGNMNPACGILSEDDVLGGGGALSLSLKDSIISVGKVWPFSQMSRSFLIFSCTSGVM